MKRITIRSAKTLLACAALAGIVSGGYVTKVSAAEKKHAAEKAEKEGDHSCKGKNSCKGKGGCAVKDGKPAHAGEEKPK